MVGVEVGDEHLPEVDQPNRRAEELPLRPLRAVEQQPLASSSDQERGRSTLGGRHRARRTEKDDVEIHGPILGLEALKSFFARADNAP